MSTAASWTSGTPSSSPCTPPWSPPSTSALFFSPNKPPTVAGSEIYPTPAELSRNRDSWLCRCCGKARGPADLVATANSCIVVVEQCQWKKPVRWPQGPGTGGQPVLAVGRAGLCRQRGRGLWRPPVRLHIRCAHCTTCQYQVGKENPADPWQRLCMPCARWNHYIKHPQKCFSSIAVYRVKRVLVAELSATQQIHVVPSRRRHHRGAREEGAVAGRTRGRRGRSAAWAAGCGGRAAGCAAGALSDSLQRAGGGNNADVPLLGCACHWVPLSLDPDIRHAVIRGDVQKLLL